MARTLQQGPPERFMRGTTRKRGIVRKDGAADSVGRKVQAARAVWALRRSFDCVWRAAPNSAQDDSL